MPDYTIEQGPSWDEIFDLSDGYGLACPNCHHVALSFNGTDGVTSRIKCRDCGYAWDKPNREWQHQTVVWVARYEHKHGETTRIFAKEVDAQEWRRAVAKDYWHAKTGAGTPPGDPQELADAYFEHVDDEFFIIEKCEVETKV